MRRASSVDDDAGVSLVLVAEAGPGAGGITAELGLGGLEVLAVGLGQLQLVGNLPKLGGAA